jgi:hypothetical protein
VVQTGQTLRHDDSSLQHNSIAAWLPESHRSLWHFTTTALVRSQSNWMACALMILLLEQGLRLEWCRLNDRYPADAVAQPGQFYVTLDGHGQRHKHNLLLHPVVYEYDNGGASKPNKLLSHIGASAVALLMDLMVSPSGPNIRAALSHGVLDLVLEQEVESLLLLGNPQNYYNDTHHDDHDGVNAVWMALTGCCCSADRSIDYRPVFSYTARTLQHLQQAQDILLQRLLLQQDDSLCGRRSTIFAELASSSTGRGGGVVNRLLVTVRHALGETDKEWTVQDLMDEHKTCSQLAPLGATRLLLEELVVAMTCVSHLPTVVHNFYVFGMYVCLRSLQQSATLLEEVEDDVLLLSRQDWNKAVQRTSMVVSTVDTFLDKNIDRSFAAMENYAKGKIAKQILAEYRGKLLLHEAESRG